MTRSSLQSALRSLVQEHGFEPVSETLQEIGLAEPYIGKANVNAARSNKGVDQQTRTMTAKITAPQYVAKMQLPPEKEAPVFALAEKFHGKTFLPTTGDIANFCQSYRIDQPASKSRASAIPRVFKFIALMDAPDIQGLLDSGMFSGPSRLGPIADAIRNYGRANPYTPPDGPQPNPDLDDLRPYGPVYTGPVPPPSKPVD